MPWNKPYAFGHADLHNEGVKLTGNKMEKHTKLNKIIAFGGG